MKREIEEVKEKTPKRLQKQTTMPLLLGLRLAPIAEADPEDEETKKNKKVWLEIFLFGKCNFCSL